MTSSFLHLRLTIRESENHETRPSTTTYTRVIHTDCLALRHIQKVVPYYLVSRMLIYLLFYFYLLPNAEAAPISIDRADTSPNSSTPFPRTLFGIIWSCLSTIIICAWTSVHPNVPPPSAWKARWNRLRLMFWMIIAPELVLAWAVRQFFAAREIRDVYNERHPGAW